MRERWSVTLALALAAGLAVGFLAHAVGPKTYRAQAVLQATAAPAPEEGPEPPTAALLAESYAHLVGERSFIERIQGQVAGGRFSADELGRRLRAERPQGTLLVRIDASGPGEEEARALATDVAAALVALAQELSRQQAAQGEDALRQRLAALEGRLAEAAGDEQQLEQLEAERAALVAQLAELPVRAAERGMGLSLVAPAAADPGATSPSLVQNLLAGAVLGLVVWIALRAFGRRRAEPVSSEQPREAPATPAEPPSVRIAEPRPGATVTGTVPLRAEASTPSVAFLLSDGGAEWRPLGDGPELEWSTAGLPEGAYWLCAVATSVSGEQAASELVPVRVR